MVASKATERWKRGDRRDLLAAEPKNGTAPPHMPGRTQLPLGDGVMVMLLFNLALG